MPELKAMNFPLDDGARAGLIFRGDILVHRQVPALVEMLALADRLIRGAFHPRAPVLAHASCDPAEFAARAEKLRATFRRHAEIKRLHMRALEQVGVELRETFWDVLRLRVQPSGTSRESATVRSLPPHRDTWGSNLMEQINWWHPIYPVARDRTMVVYPAYWERPIANDSDRWDIRELRKRRARGEKGDYPLLPVATEPVETKGELPIVIEPGDLLCFSGAHLHGSVANESGLTRFSAEFRTVNEQDRGDGRGPRNVDGRASHVAVELFRGITDSRRLGSRRPHAPRSKTRRAAS
ncbi:MAG: hypothetical protein ACE5Q3_15145 [Alphaproteobacteria bacterium]